MKRKKAPTADLDELMPILIGIWRRFRKESGPPDHLQTREFRSVVQAVKALQEQSWEGQGLLGTNYFSHPELLGAYILYNWVIHYQEGLSLLGELRDPPRRVLDVCSGAAPYALAALRHGASEVIATDQNETALNLGGEIAGRYGLPMTLRPWNCLKGPIPVEGNFDLIILAHGIQELFPETRKGWPEEQKRFIDYLITRLKPDGHLLLVDSSLKEANHRLLQLRNELVHQGVPVQAPCIWKGDCPALKANSLCYAQRELEKPPLIKEIQRAAEINLSSLKMSYILFRSPRSGWPKLPDKPLYRVISPPIESFHGKRFYLCGTEGRKSLGTTVEPLPREARAFEYLRRGELISYENLAERGEDIDIIEGSQITHEAALGKPIPEEQESYE